MLINPMTMGEACVQEQYLENIAHNKGHPSGFKKKENQEVSKEGKKKWKGGKDKQIVAAAHKCNDPSNHCNH
jgi:hypothetical protein